MGPFHSLSPALPRSFSSAVAPLFFYLVSNWLQSRPLVFCFFRHVIFCACFLPCFTLLFFCIHIGGIFMFFPLADNEIGPTGAVALADALWGNAVFSVLYVCGAVPLPLPLFLLFISDPSHGLPTASATFFLLQRRRDKRVLVLQILR